MPSNLGQDFYPKLVQMTSEVGMNPEDLLAIMVSESGINPGVGKSGNTASGLIRFMPFILPGVGFKGTPDQFRNMSGEDQLPFIKRYIADKVKYNGGPFKSAAQYYVANFWPVALKLPGVQRQNPATPIVEAHPATITDPKTGKQYSAKYYQLGIHISPQEEAEAYKDNPLFHGSTPGAITFGDMEKQVEKNKRSSLYRQALLAMNKDTGYQPKPSFNQSNMLAKHDDNSPESLDGLLDRYVKMLAADHKPSLRQSYKALPTHRFLLPIQAPDHNCAIEFGRILSSALEEDLLATAHLHSDGERVEVECQIQGPQKTCQLAVQQMSEAISEAFQHATLKIGGLSATAQCLPDQTSSFYPLHYAQAAAHYRQFQLRFLKGTSNGL
jgi:hypothetical protein